AHHQPLDPRPRRLRRVRGDLQGAQHAAHAADVGHERDPRHRDPRGDHPARRGRSPGLPERRAAADRGRLRDDQRGRRLPRDRPDARHVQGEAGTRCTPRGGGVL
ncbi:MAG: NAD(P) transhydrogenase alpha subunit, partial [uncultured Solirubrobacteraceae bacterium]